MGSFNSYSTGNNGGDKDYRPSVFSQISFVNPAGEVGGGARVSISFWKGLMKIHIQPKAGTDGNGFVKYDDKNGSYAFLTPFKASALVKGIEDIKAGKAVAAGVTVTGDTKLINIAPASYAGGTSTTNYILHIANADNTGISGGNIYDFSTGYHGYIQDFKVADNSYGKVDFDSMFEVNMFENMLKEFVNAASSATAYAVVDSMYFASNKHSYDCLNRICEKLGIATSSGNGAAKSNGSFFRNGGNGAPATGGDPEASSSSRSASKPAEITSDAIADFLADDDVPF